MALKQDLTKRQKEIFDFIGRYASSHGYPPTVREIGKAVGLTSSSTVHAHLANLEKIGMLRRDPTKPRAIEMIKETARKVIAPDGLPLVGQVAAGQSILAEENVEEYLQVPSVIGADEGDYIVRGRGDSMRDAGILEDDYVVVQSADEVADGEIAVAVLGDEATVKRIYREGEALRLEPANKDYQAVRSREAKLMGKVVGVFRRV